MANDTQDIKKALSDITPEQWSELSQLMQTPVDEVKHQYESFLVDITQNPEKLNQPGPVTVGKVESGEGRSAEGRMTIPISWCPIPKVVCLEFSLSWKGGSDWALDVNLAAKVFGKSVWSSNVIHLTSEQKYIHLQPQVAIFKMDVQIGVRQSGSCSNSFYVSGKVGYYLPFSWHYSSPFDKDLYCL
ncbi:MAG: hypothetical protein ABW123_16845 [Cystobacter sp.]